MVMVGGVYVIGSYSKQASKYYIGIMVRIDMRQTYTRTFFSSRLADGFCGLSRTLTAMAAATAKATDVKKPKTFCTRTKVECMMDAVLV